MRLQEFAQHDPKLDSIMENTTSGGTGTGSIASIANPTGSVIRRMPTTPNLFGYVEPAAKPKKKRKKPS